MKKIGIDARFMLRPLRGIPLYVTRLCQYLPEIDRDYLFYFFINKGFEHNDSPENYQPRITELMERHPNVRIINCDDDAEIRWEQIYLPRLVKEFNIDLLHMPANRITFFSKIPTVVTVHDVMEYLFLRQRYFEYLMSGNSNLKMMIYKTRIAAYAWAIYKIALKRAINIVTVSQYSATDIVKHLKISSKKVTAIHHGLDREFLVNEVNSPAGIDSFFELNSRNHVLMLGGDSYQKNPEGAIAAWAKVPQELRRKYPLKIIGFCGNAQSRLVQALEKFGLTRDVEMTGWVTQKELIGYMQSAILFLYLSRYEGFGFPVLHAMASATPIISTNKSSLPELLGDVGLQFEPDDHESIACGIASLLTDAQVWKVQANKGIKRAQLFDWRQSATKHLRLYKEILNNV